MKTQEFLQLLENNQGKELLFEYQSDQFVPNAYHITEVKNVHVDSVDCGGNEHSFDETVVQLWVSNLEFKAKAMSAEKALKIFNIVDKKRPLKRDTEIFFEWGDKNLPTSSYKVTSVANEADKIVLKLFVPATVCKPKMALAVIGAKTGGGCC